MFLARVGNTVRAACATRLGAGAKSFIHDLPNGPRTAAALGTTAETAIDLPGRARQILGFSHGGSDVVVSDDVTGAYDHGLNSTGPVNTMPLSISGRTAGCKGKTGTF